MRWNIILAMNQDGVIGYQGRLPWHCPADLAHFKAITIGHPIVMGRKTYESIGRPLPGRLNIVLTRDLSWNATGVEVIHHLEDVETVCRRHCQLSDKPQEVFIIGGAEIYKEALAYVDRLFITVLDNRCHGDTYFSFDESKWDCVTAEPFEPDEKNSFGGVFQCWHRRTSS